jgi:hypothetical protein
MQTKFFEFLIKDMTMEYSRIDQFLIMINGRIIYKSDFKFKTHAQKSIFMNVENKVTRYLRVW